MFYKLFIHLFGSAIRIHALFNSKSKAWVDGRINWKAGLADLSGLRSERVAWFHVASLGEFEQSLPIMERLKPDFRIVVTFFSPSGFAHRRAHALPDHVMYLPLDTKANAKMLVSAINPAVLVVNKYDLWFNHLNEAKMAGAKLVLVAANFRADHHYFKWYGGMGRTMLRLFDRILVQNSASAQRLRSINIISNVSGDTRYDRVLNHALNAKVPESIQEFIGPSRLIVFGSSWPVSEKMLADFIHQLPEDVKVAIAPHDIGEQHIRSICNQFPGAVRYSEIAQSQSGPVLIVDNIGLLSSLYKLADVAYVGGAFGNGLHNILEPMAFGVPVVFGPNTEKFPEAKEALEANVATQISTGTQLYSGLKNWLDQERISVSSRVVDHMNSRSGATDISVKAIHETLGITQQ